MENIMLDLETMGNTVNAAIIAIGAVEFNAETKKLGREFYCNINLESSIKYGGIADASTIIWWLKQSEGARNKICELGLPLDKVLFAFDNWLPNPKDRIKIWGNGATFDNVILEQAYINAKLPIPWKFWNNRCYRTIKALYPEIKLERVGLAHDALDDAKTQALHLINILSGAKG